MQRDIRDDIFASVKNRTYTGYIVAERDGVFSGAKRLQHCLTEFAVSAHIRQQDGAKVRSGALIASLSGSAKELAVAEEFVLGMVAKPSGIASAARRAVELAGPGLRIVCGAWKKMPPEIKEVVRNAIAHGGAAFRITDEPFVYLDKNFVRMLGGIEECLQAVSDLQDKLKVVQLKGEYGRIDAEALLAAQNGADIIMVDTGSLEDVSSVNEILTNAGLRKRIQLAFAKGIRLEAIPSLKGRGIDILDIGVAIVDAPLLDMRLELEKGPIPCR